MQRPDKGLTFELFKKTFFPFRDLNGGGATEDMDDKAEKNHKE